MLPRNVFVTPSHSAIQNAKVPGMSVPVTMNVVSWFRVTVVGLTRLTVGEAALTVMLSETTLLAAPVESKDVQ